MAKIEAINPNNESNKPNNKRLLKKTVIEAIAPMITDKFEMILYIKKNIKKKGSLNSLFDYLIKLFQNHQFLVQLFLLFPFL